MRSRNWVTSLAVPILAAISVGIAVVVFVGANNGSGGPPPSSLSAGFPPARLAAGDFADTAALTGRGTSTPLGQVAVFGNDIVAVGSQQGARIPRARFFFSPDAGRTWQVGTEQATGATEPAPGAGATLVAGGQHGWVAVGPTAAWDSQNGQSWLRGAQLPQQAGDHVTTLTATSSGFLAAGQNVPAGNSAKASPVVWLSTNGTTWRRIAGTQLALPAAAGTVLGITGAASNGNTIVVSGTMGGTMTGSALWRSTNGGASWTAVTLPAGNGASATISGISPLNGGFVSVSPAQVTGDAGANVYTSKDGATWQLSAQLVTADGAPLTVGLVTGGPHGAVVTGQARGLNIAFLSRDGATWAGTDPIGKAGGEQISGVALSPKGQAVLSATSIGGNAGHQPLLTLIGIHGGPVQVNLRKIQGAVTGEVAVNAIAAAAGTQVAAGSADGLPAMWMSTDGGSQWTRVSPGVLAGPGDQQLTGVVHGPAGWLAVGGDVGAAAEPPVVVGSADGKTWKAVGGGTTFAGPGQIVPAAAAAGTSKYVIAGRETTGDRTIAVTWYANGITGWARGSSAQPGALDGPGNRQMNAVTATAKGFAAVGAAGTRPAAWLSADGRSWALVTLPLPASAAQAELGFVAANGNTVAAAGTAVTAAGQQLPFAAVSANGGTTWTVTALPKPSGKAAATAVTALAAAGGGFTATGTYGAPGNEDVVVWMLARGAAPGTAWTPAAPTGTGLSMQGTQAITALTATGSALTGVGFTATPASEEPTIWQSPVRS